MGKNNLLSSIPTIRNRFWDDFGIGILKLRKFIRIKNSGIFKSTKISQNLASSNYLVSLVHGWAVGALWDRKITHSIRPKTFQYKVPGGGSAKGAV